MKTIERFLNYVKFDTQSMIDSSIYPSTDKQWKLIKFLEEELKNLGVNTSVDEFGYVIGRIPSNINKKVPTIGLIAHIDTAPDASGTNVKAKIIKNYDGKDIILNIEKNIILKPSVFPTLKNNLGHDIVVTDGTTLLGADDKLGVAEIMTVVEYIQNNPDYSHGEVVVLFTPDEEVGDGTKFIDIKKIKADFAYTLDGSQVGEIAYENFNAAGVKVNINGKSVHPGSAKNKMLHSVNVAFEFDRLLPQQLKPEHTEGYEGFNHLTSINGIVEKTLISYIIRNHDRKLFEKQKSDFIHACETINKKYGDKTCIVNIEDQYFNMNDILKNYKYIIDIAKEATIEAGVKPIIDPIRGGTDGARLTYMGLPCPNLGTGGYNFHGPYEYCSINEMNLAIKIVKGIISKTAKIN